MSKECMSDASLKSQISLEAEDQETEENLALLQAVEIHTESLEKRQRRISAKIEIPAPLEAVWALLTDYETLPEFIPNLAVSKRLEHPEGGIRLEQVGTQRLLRLKFSARVVLDMEEDCPSEIRFNMVEGDFKAFSGYWKLQPRVEAPLASDESVSDRPITDLLYSVIVWPKLTMPVKLIENRICKDLRLNLLAIRQKVVGLSHG